MEMVMTQKTDWQVVLYSAGGGELDREPVAVTGNDDDDENRSVSEAVQRLAERCVFAPGDQIVIKGEE
jgi:hypothetical protein